MSRRSLLGATVLLLTLGAGGAALAGPVGPVRDMENGDTLVEKVWGCHRSCERGPGGWHRHVGPLCVRVACVPRAWYPNRCFVDRWGYRHCRW
jgi:hypothetical protein